MTPGQIVHELQTNKEFRQAVWAALTEKQVKPKPLPAAHALPYDAILAMCPVGDWFFTRDVYPSINAQFPGMFSCVSVLGMYMDQMRTMRPDLEKRRWMANLLQWRINTVDKPAKPI